MIFLFLLFIALPIAEIYVLLTAGSLLGPLPVVLGVVATAIIGSIIIRWQGLQALHTLRNAMAAGETPVAPMVDGVFLLIAAPFLMTPGFITDAFGFLLLVPFIRHALARIFLSYIKKNMDKGNGRFTVGKF